MKGLIILYTGRIRELLAEQMEHQAAFERRKAQIINNGNLTPQGQREPLERLEQERSAQAAKAWAGMLKTLQEMKAVEVAPLTAAEAAQLAVTGQIIGSLDPKAPGTDTTLDAILQPFQGRIPAQRILASALRKSGFVWQAEDLENRIYDPDELYDAIAYFAQEGTFGGSLSETSEAFSYLDAIDRNAPDESGPKPIEPSRPERLPGVHAW